MDNAIQISYNRQMVCMTPKQSIDDTDITKQRNYKTAKRNSKIMNKNKESKERKKKRKNVFLKYIAAVLSLLWFVFIDFMQYVQYCTSILAAWARLYES